MDLVNTVVLDINSVVPLFVSFLLLFNTDMDLANTVVVDLLKVLDTLNVLILIVALEINRQKSEPRIISKN